MNDTTADTAPQAAIVIERTYRAEVAELWALWTTRSGFESWWGPEGFRVEVHALDAREGGELAYDMIADAPEMVAAMKQMGQPISQGVRGHYTGLAPGQRLTLIQRIDFVPGSAPYDSKIEVEFRALGDQAHMVVTVHPHLDPLWTGRAVQGFQSQLTKLDARFGGAAPDPVRS